MKTEKEQKKENLWLIYDEEQLEQLEKVCTNYREFLDTGKTERECVSEIIRQAEENGYRNLYAVDTLKPGDKVYAAWMKNLLHCFRLEQRQWKKG